ncbi:unnamed protein product [Phytomonas sp. Hart1]|nr:unnamed protein product [Phytomonas sp. Hart1]|eukprot:CCW66132.1 unnamed protein product [Phytomonas sp. isolate Hart1]
MLRISRVECTIFRRAVFLRGQFDDFSKILSQGKTSCSSNMFDGNFKGGDGLIDPSQLADMHSVLSANMSPEMQDSMKSFMDSIRTGDGLPQGFGVMAFGLDENEKGKKVARAARMMYDTKSGKVEKDFIEQQLEPDDMSLPKDTVGDYSTEGALDTEFVEDQNTIETKPVEPISEAEISIESDNEFPVKH